MKLQAAFALVVLMGTPAIAQDLAPVALNSLSSAPAAIVSAQVFDEHYRPMGRVKNWSQIKMESPPPSVLSLTGPAGWLSFRRPPSAMMRRRTFLSPIRFRSS
jgi:hypothetical protein